MVCLWRSEGQMTYLGSVLLHQAWGGEWRLGLVYPEPSSLLLTLLQTVVCRNLGTCTHLDLLRIANHSLRVTSSPAPAL